MYIYFSLFFFLKKIPTKFIFNKLKISFSGNNNSFLFKPLFSNKLFGFTINNNFNKLIKLFQNILTLNKNILFIDFNFNFNYLPVTNTILFSRSAKSFNKVLKYFNISFVVFLNLNKKKFIFKKLFSSKVINISTDNNTFSNKFDLNLSLPQNKLINYILYLCVMNIYLIVKNKNLKINGSALFFF